jgi:hypothetical protein
MPQLDKISFATQYFWLTLFFFSLYFLTVNFFVIAVFKNLRLRNMIYKIWYFFLYKFDYNDYNNKNKKITELCFNAIYYNLYINFFIWLKVNSTINKVKGLLNKSYTFSSINNSLINSKINALVLDNFVLNENLITSLNNIDIDEI